VCTAVKREKFGCRSSERPRPWRELEGENRSFSGSRHSSDLEHLREVTCFQSLANAGHNLRGGRARALHVRVRVRGGKAAKQGA